jgi:hypothetical protein
VVATQGRVLWSVQQNTPFQVLAPLFRPSASANSAFLMTVELLQQS